MLYVPNPNFADEWAASEDALALADQYAQAAAPLAAAGAPRDRGDLAESVEAVSGFVDGKATGRVIAKDFKAGWKEWGTRREPAQPFLRPAMEAVTGVPVTGGRT